MKQTLVRILCVSSLVFATQSSFCSEEGNSLCLIGRVFDAPMRYLVDKTDVTTFKVGEYAPLSFLENKWAQVTISLATYVFLYKLIMKIYRDYQKRKREFPKKKAIKSAVDQLKFLENVMKKTQQEKQVDEGQKAEEKKPKKIESK